MSKIENIYNELTQAVEHPKATVLRYAQQTDRKIVGCAPYYTPYEMVHAADLYPVEIYGGDIEITNAYKYYPTFYCSVLLSLMESALAGRYDFMEAVIIPVLCDGLRNLEENWKYGVPSVPVIPMAHPNNRKLAVAEQYYTTDLHVVRKRLEEISGVEVTDKKMRESLKIYNKQKQLMRELSDLATRHLDVVTPLFRYTVFKASRVLPVEAHIALVEDLIEELKKLPEHDFKGVKVVSTGILIDSVDLLKTLEDHDIAIVADMVVAESLRFSTDAPDSPDPFVSLARVWTNLEGCCFAFDTKKLRAPMMVDLAKKYNADGFLVDILKFCEEEEFDYPILKRYFEKAGYPLLHIETEQQEHMNEQATTRIQAFKEMIDLA